MIQRRSAIVLVFLLLLSGVGCSKRFFIKPPTPSSVVYTNPAPVQTHLSIRDARSEADKDLSTGRLTAVLDGLEGNEVQFLGEHIENELVARGANLQWAEASDGDLQLELLKFRIRNHRATGFSPYWTFTTFSADLSDGSSRGRVTAYFKNGKVPVWAFREVEEPTYNVPVSLLIKEVATKINARVFRISASAEEVQRIAGAVAADNSELRYIKVFELGYTNNPAAIPHVLELIDDDGSLVSAAAISCLGMLQAQDQFDLLTRLYENREDIDKVMALKSIGDLDTEESRQFIISVSESDDYDDEMIREVVDLYR
jgi:hypothetical protein